MTDEQKQWLRFDEVRHQRTPRYILERLAECRKLLDHYINGGARDGDCKLCDSAENELKGLPHNVPPTGS